MCQDYHESSDKNHILSLCGCMPQAKKKAFRCLCFFLHFIVGNICFCGHWWQRKKKKQYNGSTQHLPKIFYFICAELEILCVSHIFGIECNSDSIDQQHKSKSWVMPHSVDTNVSYVKTEYLHVLSHFSLYFVIFFQC